MLLSSPPASQSLPDGAIPIARLTGSDLHAFGTSGAPFLVFPAWSHLEQAPAFTTAFQEQGPATTSGPVAFQLMKRPGRPFPDQVGVGRTRNSDICLPFPDISKYHACFFRVDGVWELMDAGSANGTIIAGKAADARARVPVRGGTQISFAKHRCIFIAEEDFADAVKAFQSGA